MRKYNSKFAMFLKRNALYFVLAFCILAIGLSVMFAIIREDKGLPNQNGGDIVVDKPGQPSDNDTPSTDGDNPNAPNQPVVTVISFIMPVNNATAIEEYSESLVFNQTLNRYSTHKAMDFFAPEGTSVFAVYDGKVTNIENNPLLTGVTITIDHGNGLQTFYNSLADGDSVFIGQSVKQGDVIGQVSVSNRQEYKESAHLHFEVREDGININPEKYLTLQEK